MITLFPQEISPLGTFPFTRVQPERNKVGPVELFKLVAIPGLKMLATPRAVLNHDIGYQRDRMWEGDQGKFHIGVHSSILEDHASGGLSSIAEYSEAALASHICVSPKSQAAPPDVVN